MKITAPFSPEQVDALNAWQSAGLVHPFTCGTETCRTPLIATPLGWECAYCEYTQNWAHDFMADPEVTSKLKDALDRDGTFKFPLE